MIQSHDINSYYSNFSIANIRVKLPISQGFNTFLKVSITACILSLSFNLSAQVSQNFEGLTARDLQGTCLYEDGDVSSIHILQNYNSPVCGLITVISPSAGSTLGFQNIFDPVNTAQDPV